MNWETFQLDIGSRGSWVRLAQTLLMNAGQVQLVRNGIFDDAMQTAVENFQQERLAGGYYNGYVDGRIGPLTIRLLLKASSMDEVSAEAALDPWTSFVNSDTGDATIILKDDLFVEEI